MDSARDRANSYDDQMPEFVSRIEDEANPVILVQRNSQEEIKTPNLVT
jgi:hypothetical protein